MRFWALLRQFQDGSFADCGVPIFSNIRLSPSRFQLLAWVALFLSSFSAGAAQIAHFGSVQVTVAGCSSECFGVAVDGSGNVYIADTYNNRVLKETLSASGYTESVVAIGLNLPYGVAVDGSGNVYVADTYNNQIVKETWSSGSYSPSVIASARSPWNVAVDKNGNVYVVGGNAGAGSAPYIYKETPSGSTYAQSTVADASNGLSIPWEVAVDGSGNVFVTDTGTNAVYKESLTGSTYTQSTVATGLNFPTGVAVDAIGNVYVANAYQNQILMETPGSGNTYTQSIIATGKLTFPYELATDSAGNLYIANPQAFDILEVSTASAYFGRVDVGSQSLPVSIVFAFDASTSISQPAVLTGGLANLDYTDSGTGSCTTNGTAVTYAAGQTCIVDVVFRPTISGGDFGAAVLTDHVGDQIAVAYLQGTGVGPQLNFLPGTQTALPSQGLQGPSSLAVDDTGNIFFIDGNNVMKESYSGGSYTLSTLFSNLANPTSLAVDAAGNIYIALVGSRSLVTETPYSGGYYQSLSVTGLSLPLSVAVDSQGSIYVADAGLRELIKMTPTASAYAISSLNSGLQPPQSVAVSASGVVYISDGIGGITVQTPTSAGYVQSTLTLSGVKATTLATDGRDNLYTVDEFGGKVTKWTASSGTYSPSAIGANLSSPLAIAIDRNGNAYISNEGTLQILKVDSADPPSMSFASTGYRTTSTDSPQTTSVLNIGNADLKLAVPASGENPTISSSFSLSNDAAECPQVGAGGSAATLAAGASCELGISFTPQAIGAISGSLVLTDNNLNVSSSQQTIALTGNATRATPTIDWPVPAAIVYGAQLGAGQLNATASAAGTFSYSPTAGTVLSAGQHTLTSQFTPTDTTDYTSATATVVLTVDKATPAVSSWPTASIITYGQSLTSSTLTGGGGSVPGSFAWSAPSTIPSAGTIVESVTFTPTDTANYATVTGQVNVTINQATPVITWPVPASVPFGTTLSATQLNATANVPGTFVYTPAVGTILSAAGDVPLSAVFTPTDGRDYGVASASVTLNVNANPALQISGGAVAVLPGAGTGSTITVTPLGGFTGVVNLTAAVTSSPAGAQYPPTLSFGSAGAVSITGTTGANATLTISTTAASTTCSSENKAPRGFGWYAGGGATLACFLLVAVPRRRPRWKIFIGLIVLGVVLGSGVTGCGGGKSNAPCTAVMKGGTTPGNYTISVTGTSGSIKATGTVLLTVQ